MSKRKVVGDNCRDEWGWNESSAGWAPGRDGNEPRLRWVLMEI